MYLKRTIRYTYNVLFSISYYKLIILNDLSYNILHDNNIATFALGRFRSEENYTENLVGERQKLFFFVVI